VQEGATAADKLIYFGPMPQKRDREGRMLRCPRCDSTDVRRTERLGLIAWMFQIIGRAPFLCRSYRRRFFRHGYPVLVGD
jgi:hypothetical protein